MMRISHNWLLLGAVVLLTHNGFASAYEVGTHKILSEQAYTVSDLNNDQNVLTNLGLSVSDTFPNSQGVGARTVFQLIGEGAEFEDDTNGTKRPLNHFYDPVHNLPLNIGGIKVGDLLCVVPGIGCQPTEMSPDWATEDSKDVSAQAFSFKDARKYFYDALTLPVDKQTRDKFWGLTFQSLGQVIHHIQDMAQPQHVRNDMHLDENEFFGFNPLYNPSLYEKYTKSLGTLPFAGYNPVYTSTDTATFNTARKFWHTDDGKGLADYTNRGFVSAGTIFDSSFPSPVVDTNIKQNLDIQQLLPGTSLKGVLTFYGNTVTDNFTGASVTNPWAVTSSIFDADLKKYSTAFKKEVFSLNRFNFDVAHSLLIPRAVGYSAGLINYFFRGKLDFIADTNNPGKYVIKNLGPEDMKGTFTLYYDAADGKRYPIAGDGPDKTWADRSVSKSSQLDDLSFVVPTDPEPAHSGEYMLVFSGDMGEEKASAGVTIGAVAAKFIHGEPDIKIHSYLGSGVFSFSPNGAFTGSSAGLIGSYFGTYFRGISVYDRNVFMIQYNYSSSISDFVLRNDVSFAESLEFYDTAASAAGVFVTEVLGEGGQSAQVKVFDHNGIATNSFPVNPDYNQLGGQVEVAANATHIATTNNEYLYIYTVNGNNVATVGGLDIFSQKVAMTKDRVFYVNGTILKVFDLAGAQQKLLDLTSVINGPLACIEATEKRFYVVTYSGGIYYLNIFTRAVSRDKDGNILSDDYAFYKTINLAAYISNVGTCTVDTAYMNYPQFP